jgi:FKBP-type peptidyl-prolyl cis-trans isomerase FklB
MYYKAGLAFLLLGATVVAQGAELKTEKQRFSYTLGFQVGADFKRKGIEIDPNTFAAAIADVAAGKKPALSQEQMQAALENYRQTMIARVQALAAENQKAGDAYREANRKKAGVKELPNGLQYKVLKEGSGKQPQPSDTVEVHYRGTLVDGREFDSSYNRKETVTFPLTGVIKGWQEILPLMKIGEKREVVIPPELAYGPNGSPPAIGPNSTLIFEIELIGIK